MLPTIRLGLLEYFDRSQTLVDGRVRPEGLKLDITVSSHPGDLFRQMVQGKRFDAGELSLSTYAIMRSRGDDRYTAIPAFLSRNFRHSYIFVSSKSGITTPEGLRGRRVGIPEYQLTGAVWIRGFLQHEYGVHPRDVRWVSNWNTDVDARGRAPRLDLHLPPDIKIEDPGDEYSMSELLENGQIDALIGSTVPACVRRGSPLVRRLFENYVEAEKAYFRKTGIFPIMHVVAVRRELCARYPQLSRQLFDAFCRAKALGLERLKVTGHLACCLPWLRASLDEIQGLFGPDFWPYGLAPNRHVMDCVLTYMAEQGLTARRLKADELFEPLEQEISYA